MGSAMRRCVGRRIVGDGGAGGESSDDEGEKVVVRPPSKKIPAAGNAQQSLTSSNTSNRQLVNQRQHNLSKIRPFSSSSNWVRKSIIRRKKFTNNSNISEENSTNNEQRNEQYSMNNNRNLNTLIDDQLMEENNHKNRINDDSTINSDELLKSDNKRTWKKYIPFGSKLFGHDRNEVLSNEASSTAESRASPSSPTRQYKYNKSHAGANAPDADSIEKEALRLAYQARSSIEHPNDLQAAIAYGGAAGDEEQQQQLLLHQRQQNFRLHTDMLYKNFQDRLANTQEQSAKPNLKMTQSQIEFFRMLDEKIAQGSSFDRDSFS